MKNEKINKLKTPEQIEKLLERERQLVELTRLVPGLDSWIKLSVVREDLYAATGLDKYKAPPTSGL